MMRFIDSLLCISVFAVLCFFVVSCSRSAEYAEGEMNAQAKGVAINKTDPKQATARQSLQGIACASAYSADLVFLSDPVFALYFITDKRSTYSGFYAMALRKKIDARMFVAAEEPALSRLGLAVDNIPKGIRKEFKPLSKGQLTTALRARSVVLSPIMRLFAPRQVQRIEHYRIKCSLPPMRTLGVGGYANEKNTVNVRYTQAVRELAVGMADFMQEKGFETMVAILDAPTTQNVENMSVLISTLKNKVSNFKVRLLWKTRNPSSEAKSFEQLNGVANYEVVLLYAGMYTSKASQYLREREIVEKERIFAIMDWQHLPYKMQNIIGNGIYASLWVAIPLNALFENKNYINAKLYRGL